jgi:hypothetical protein
MGLCRGKVGVAVERHLPHENNGRVPCKDKEEPHNKIDIQ